MVPHRAKANPFERPSILFRPQLPAMTGFLVEPPGTAPGSDPSITSAFIAIVPLPEHFEYRHDSLTMEERAKRLPSVPLSFESPRFPSVFNQIFDNLREVPPSTAAKGPLITMFRALPNRDFLQQSRIRRSGAVDTEFARASFRG